jgi:hypothetical protein
MGGGRGTVSSWIYGQVMVGIGPKIEITSLQIAGAYGGTGMHNVLNKFCTV